MRSSAAALATPPLLELKLKHLLVDQTFEGGGPGFAFVDRVGRLVSVYRDLDQIAGQVVATRQTVECFAGRVPLKDLALEADALGSAFFAMVVSPSNARHNGQMISTAC